MRVLAATALHLLTFIWAQSVGSVPYCKTLWEEQNTPDGASCIPCPAGGSDCPSGLIEDCWGETFCNAAREVCGEGSCGIFKDNFSGPGLAQNWLGDSGSGKKEIQEYEGRTCLYIGLATTYLQRTISTFGYDTITVSVTWSKNLLESNDYCYVKSFSDSTELSSDHKLNTEQSKEFTTLSITMPASASNNEKFAIRLGLQGGTADHCYFDQVIVSGRKLADSPDTPDSVPTKTPTPVPTKTPTPVPTKTPTPVPTKTPTPVPTKTPTPVPTKIPTPVPTDVPSHSQALATTADEAFLAALTKMGVLQSGCNQCGNSCNPASVQCDGKKVRVIEAQCKVGDKISGQLPSLDGLTSLEVLNLDGCGLSGSLPDMRQASSLIELILPNNSLSLHKHDSFDALTNLKKLDLRSNKFSGLLPSFRNLGNLATLDVSSNSFTTTGDASSCPSCPSDITNGQCNMASNPWEHVDQVYDVPCKAVAKNLLEQKLNVSDGSILNAVAISKEAADSGALADSSVNKLAQALLGSLETNIASQTATIGKDEAGQTIEAIKGVIDAADESGIEKAAETFLAAVEISLATWANETDKTQALNASLVLTSSKTVETLIKSGGCDVLSQGSDTLTKLVSENFARSQQGDQVSLSGLDSMSATSSSDSAAGVTIPEGTVEGSFAIHTVDYGGWTSQCGSQSTGNDMGAVRSIFITDQFGQEISITQLSEPLQFLLPASDFFDVKCDKEQELSAFECRYFDKQTQMWSTAGCRASSIIYAAGQKNIECECTHLTEFALALDRQKCINRNSVSFLVFGCLSGSLLVPSVWQLYQGLRVGKQHVLQQSNFVHGMLAIMCLASSIADLTTYFVNSSDQNSFGEILKAAMSSVGLPLFSLILTFIVSSWAKLNSIKLSSVASSLIKILVALLLAVEATALFMSFRLENEGTAYTVALAGTTLASSVIFVQAFLCAYLGFRLVRKLNHRSGAKSKYTNKVIFLSLGFCLILVAKCCVLIGVFYSSLETRRTQFEKIKVVDGACDMVCICLILLMFRQQIRAEKKKFARASFVSAYTEKPQRNSRKKASVAIVPLTDDFDDYSASTSSRRSRRTFIPT